jgi:hypothetical protein
MKAYSKEFYDAMKFFEGNISKYVYGNFRFDKYSSEERKNLPKGEWYLHGDTNRFFKAFLLGTEFGKSMEW